jgi:hypothetical protein
MQRRKFFETSASLSVGAILGGCKSVATENDHINMVDNNQQFKIIDLAPKPPLGWNSFDSYGVYLHEKAAMENLKAFVEKLQPSGYEYFVIDGGWYGEYKLIPGTLYPVMKNMPRMLH